MTAQKHRRAAAAIRRSGQLKNLPSNVHVLDPRFSPTAIFSDQLATLTDILSEILPTNLFSETPSTIETTSATISATLVSQSTTPALSSSPVDTITSTVVVAPPATTTSTTPIAPSTTVAPLPTSNTSVPTSFKTIVSTSTRPISSPSTAAASSTSTAEPSSGMSTGAIVGGIGAGIVAVAALGFAVAYFLRRSRQRSSDETSFNPTDFRRSAVLMNDPPTHEDTINRGFNPRPPSMVERRFASPAPTFGTQYGAPGPAYGDCYSNYDNNSYAQGPYPSFGPGQVMHSTSPPPTANSANPLFPAPAHYGQSPFSPIASPTSSVGPYEPMYNERGEPIPSPYLTRQPSSGARQPSPGYGSPVDISRQMPTGAVYPAIARQPSLNNPHVDRNTPPANVPVPLTHENVPSDYVDLSRSSVSPFQAAQYAEISRKLNTEVPNGLDTPSVNQIMGNHRISNGSSNSDRDLPQLPDREHESPFADPSLSVSSKNTLSPRPISSESIGHELEFPTPPSPGPTMSSRYRVDSTPPTLPEIHLESRVSVSSYGGYDTPGSNNGPGPSPLGSGFPSGVSGAATVGAGRNLVPESPYINRFPITPSPLASSFGMPTPPVGRSFEASPPPSVHQPHTSDANGDTPVSTGNVTTRNTNPESSGKRPDTVYSMYDAEDAYGGI